MPAGRARALSFAALALALLAGAYYAYRALRGPSLPPGIASGNGRIEATQYDIATKRAGRLVEVAVGEGDMVSAGQMLARIDSADLEAQRRAAAAELAKALETRAVAVHVVAQRKSDAKLARAELRRVEALFEKKVASPQLLDEVQARSESADAGLRVASGNVDAAEASIRCPGSMQARRHAACSKPQSSAGRSRRRTTSRRCPGCGRSCFASRTSCGSSPTSRS